MQEKLSILFRPITCYLLTHYNNWFLFILFLVTCKLVYCVTSRIFVFLFKQIYLHSTIYSDKQFVSNVFVSDLLSTGCSIIWETCQVLVLFYIFIFNLASCLLILLMFTKSCLSRAIWNSCRLPSISLCPLHCWQFCV
jgi:hypothetical protein